MNNCYVIVSNFKYRLVFVHHVWYFSRMKGFEPEDTEADASLRIVISAPDKNMPLERADIAFMLVQYEAKDDDRG